MESKTERQTEPSILEKEINIAVGTSRYTLKWKNKSISVKEFIERLSKPTVTQETVKEYQSMLKGRQDDLKDVGGYVGGLLKGGRRTANSVANRSIITLDLDHAEQNNTDRIISRIESAMGSMAWVVHSTHKHTEENPRLRIVSFLDRPVYADEYQAIARKLAERINIEWFDDSTFEPHRLMFWPSIPSDAKNVFIDYTVSIDGAELVPVPADEILSEYGPDEAWKDTTFWPTSSRQAAVLKREIERQADPLTKKGVVGAFCRVYDIHAAISSHLSEVYRHEGGDRYTFLDGSTSKGLSVYDNKFAYSHHSTDPASNVLCNAFDLVRIHKFGHLDENSREDVPTHKLQSYKAMCEFAEEIKEVKVEMIKNLFTDVELNEEPDQQSNDDWLQDLSITKDGVIKPTFGNACEILTHDKKVKDLIWLNEFTGLKEYGRGGREWTNDDTLMIRKFIGDKYKVDFPAGIIADAVDWKANQQKHHPVREYLKSLEWDGVKRVESLWIDYLGEEDNIYTRETAKCWLLAAVSRIMSPGYKFDYVPVIYGPQGIGKSTFCATLTKSADWFGELTSFNDQNAVEQMRGKWIMELSELSVTNKSELEQQKHFISSTKTCVRLAYRRDPGIFKRHCVFIGSTNQREYLKDSTGNRRWWPLDCETKFEPGQFLDLKTLRENVDQIWAEVMDVLRHRFRDRTVFRGQEDRGRASGIETGI